MKYKTMKRNEIGNFLTQPLLWFPLVIFLLLDLFAELYHRICFPIYGIELVKRKNYIQVMDRTKLQYLNWWEKIGCMYCGYANGLLPYINEITNRTEQYWCGIMHENKPGFVKQPHQINKNFAKYNDEEDFNDKYNK